MKSQARFLIETLNLLTSEADYSLSIALDVGRFNKRYWAGRAEALEEATQIVREYLESRDVMR